MTTTTERQPEATEGCCLPITVHTDGSCIGNPGPGGWAYLIKQGERSVTRHGAALSTTNNRMELLAAIKALETIKPGSASIRLVSDSTYLVSGMTRWLAGWKQRGWRTATKREVSNKDLWLRLDVLAADRDVRWEWCPGHSGIEENELVDKAAYNAANRET